MPRSCREGGSVKVFKMGNYVKAARVLSIIVLWILAGRVVAGWWLGHMVFRLESFIPPPQFIPNQAPIHRPGQPLYAHCYHPIKSISSASENMFFDRPSCFGRFKCQHNAEEVIRVCFKTSLILSVFSKTTKLEFCRVRASFYSTMC